MSTTSGARNATRPSNAVFFVALAVTVGVLLVGAGRAAVETETNLAYHALLRRMQRHVQAKQIPESLPLLRELERRDPRDYRVTWQLGASLLRTRRIAQAETYFRRTLQLNPLIVLMPVYLLQFASIEAALGKDEIALAYLAELRKKETTAEIKAAGEQLQRSIDEHRRRRGKAAPSIAVLPQRSIVAVAR